MFLTVLDLILVLIIFTFIAVGFAVGLIHAFGALVGVIAGAWVAGLLFEPVGQWLTPILLGHENLAMILAFIIIFTVINRLFGLVFWLIDKIFHLFSFIPFTKFLNRFLGGIFGLLEGVILVGLTLLVIDQKFGSSAVSQWITDSVVAQLLITLASLITPLLPQIYSKLKDSFNNYVV